MPLLFDKNGFTSFFLNILSNESYSRKYEKLSNIVSRHVNLSQKKHDCVEHLWLEHLAFKLFVCVSAHCV